MKRALNFFNDEDGFSAKDFVMLAFVTVFIVEQATVFVLSLMGTVNADTLTIIRSLDGIMMTIIGGVFSVQAVREFRRPRGEDAVAYEYEQDAVAYGETPSYNQPVAYNEPTVYRP